MKPGGMGGGVGGASQPAMGGLPSAAGGGARVARGPPISPTTGQEAAQGGSPGANFPGLLTAGVAPGDELAAVQQRAISDATLASLCQDPMAPARPSDPGQKLARLDSLVTNDLRV